MGLNEFFKIGTKMKKLRKAYEISQKDMANKLGIPVSTYSNYENNLREPPLSILNAFCQQLNFSILDLFTFPESIFDDLLSNSLDPDDVHYEALNIVRSNQTFLSLLDLFLKLNATGQAEALKRVEELTYVDKYVKSEEES